jgi:leucyl-tRNA synthetase
VAAASDDYDKDNLNKAERELRRALHLSIKKVTEDIGLRFNFNTAISSIMELVNAMYALKEVKAEPNPGLIRETISGLLKLLAPFAPHITEELWHNTIGTGSVHKQAWPEFDAKAVEVDEVEIVVQINGKVREKITVPVVLTPKQLEELALGQDKVKKLINDKQIVKIICVPKKLVNIVVK